MQHVSMCSCEQAQVPAFEAHNCCTKNRQSVSTRGRYSIPDRQGSQAVRTNYNLMMAIRAMCKHLVAGTTIAGSPSAQGSTVKPRQDSLCINLLNPSTTKPQTHNHLLQQNTPVPWELTGAGDCGVAGAFAITEADTTADQHSRSKYMPS